MKINYLQHCSITSLTSNKRAFISGEEGNGKMGEVISLMVLLVFICQNVRMKLESSDGSTSMSSKRAREVGEVGFYKMAHFPPL